MLGGDPTRSWYPFSYDQSFDWADRGARLTGAALMVTEYGGDPPYDGSVLSQELAAQERHLTGSTFWTWKENCGFGASWGLYAGVYGETPDQRCSYDRPRPDTAARPADGGLRPERARLLSRAWPRAVAGTPLSYSYDPGAGRFAMRARAERGVAPGSRAEETVVYLPAAAGGSVLVGGAVLDAVEAVPGGRLAYVAPTGGEYWVSS
jgi:hypothetical protein